MKTIIQKGNSIATPAFAATELKFNNSRNKKVSPISKRTDTLLTENQNEDDNQAMAFIEEYAFCDQSQAVRSLIRRANYSDTNEYEINEDDIYMELASGEHKDFVGFIVSDQLLDFESIA